MSLNASSCLLGRPMRYLFMLRLDIVLVRCSVWTRVASSNQVWVKPHPVLCCPQGGNDFVVILLKLKVIISKVVSQNSQDLPCEDATMLLISRYSAPWVTRKKDPRLRLALREQMPSRGNSEVILIPPKPTPPPKPLTPSRNVHAAIESHMNAGIPAAIDTA